MKLTIKERFALNLVLPERASLIKKLMANNILEKVRFTSEEIELFQMKDLSINDNKQIITWDTTIQSEVDFEFTTSELVFMRDSAKIVDEQEQVNNENLSLIEKLLK
jgi:hypothetical protein